MHKFIPKIGLEIHIALISKTKAFSIVPVNKYSWISLGFPGVLPQINFSCIKSCLKLASLLNMNSNYSNIRFDRKNYFYFDLPRGYQITQFFNPIGKFGDIFLPLSKKKINLRQLHLEEDTAKQNKFDNLIKIDYTRLGNPLVELVTEPDFSNFDEVQEFLKILKSMCIFLNISKAEYELGQIRIDLNISIKDLENNVFSPKSEIKNLNSLNSIKKSINYQINYLSSKMINKEKIESYTFNWNEQNEECEILRKKFLCEEYFYIPEANIPVIKISDEEYKKIIFENENYFKFLKKIYDSGMSIKEINHLLENYTIFWDTKKINDYLNNWRKSYIWRATLIGGIINNCNKKNIKINFSIELIIELIKKIEGNDFFTQKIIKNILIDIIVNKISLKTSLKNNSVENSLIDLKKLVLQELDENKDQIPKLLLNMKKFENFIIGQIIKKNSGKVNPVKVSQIFKKNIDAYLKEKHFFK